ncbi:MAG TPA: hypothetical protein VIT42_03585 [Microlunatus sp.]
MTVAAEVSTRTTAACADCVWTSGTLTGDLSVRVAARQHTDLTQHRVVVLANTINVLQPGRTGDAAQATVRAEAVAVLGGTGQDRTS